MPKPIRDPLSSGVAEEGRVCYVLQNREKKDSHMQSEQKTKRKLRAVANAVAQQRIEGLVVPPDVVEEMKRAARGEITIEDGIYYTFRKFAHDKIRGTRPLP